LRAGSPRARWLRTRSIWPIFRPFGLTRFVWLIFGPFGPYSVRVTRPRCSAHLPLIFESVGVPGRLCGLACPGPAGYVLDPFGPYSVRLALTRFVWLIFGPFGPYSVRVTRPRCSAHVPLIFESVGVPGRLCGLACPGPAGYVLDPFGPYSVRLALTRFVWLIFGPFGPYSVRVTRPRCSAHVPLIFESVGVPGRLCGLACPGPAGYVLDPFGPYSVRLALTRFVWLIFGPFGPYSVRVTRPRCSAHVPLIFESVGVPGRLCGLARPGPAGYVLDPFGPYSVRLALTRFVWLIFGPFGPYSVRVTRPRCSAHVPLIFESVGVPGRLCGLACPGPAGYVLDPFGPYSVRLALTRFVWLIFGPFGPYSVRVTRPRCSAHVPLIFESVGVPGRLCGLARPGPAGYVLDPFGPYSVRLALTRFVWLIFGPFGPYSVRVTRPRCSAHVPLIFESVGVPGRLCGLACPGPAGYVLDPFGPYSVRLALTRFVWLIFGPFGPYSVRVTRPRCSAHVPLIFESVGVPGRLCGLACPGPAGYVLDPFGPYSVRLALTRFVWLIFGPFGPYSVRVTRPRCSAHVPLIFESVGVPGRLCGLACPGPAGYVLDPFGPYSVRLALTRFVWLIFGPFGP
jgi:hypothetical protein